MAHVPPLTPGSRLYPTSGTTAALVRGPFADAALGTLGIVHGAVGTAALLAGGASADLACAGASTAAGAASGGRSSWGPIGRKARSEVQSKCRSTSPGPVGGVL